MSGKLVDRIIQLKKDNNAVILAHYYQLPEIQEIADFVGDSLQLAQKASQTKADVIVSCGVRFMAETAKILNPEKMVLLPASNAGCPMADMVTADALRDKKAEHPDAVVVTYVNSSAAVKAESDICCTSSNAVRVVESVPPDQEILFVPDRNLGQFVASQTGRRIILWDGYCPVHDVLAVQELQAQMEAYPDARVVVHPECQPDISARADAVKSTAGILDYIKNTDAKTFIVGTEEGFLHTVQQDCPDKTCYLARKSFVCKDMKQIDLQTLVRSMEGLEEQVIVPEGIRQKAYQALENMLRLG
ncbi:MAG: quinolinate synthase NadA [Bacillota bacterium]|nr:quinolinate synthase NadA [Bacillota bacterium]